MSARHMGCAWILCMLLSAPVALFAGTPMGTAFTYQGRLTDSGGPANGQYDLEFTLYEDQAGASAVAGPVTIEDRAVANGLFTVKLDFGSGLFTGNARWLKVGVRPYQSTGVYTYLSPLQELTPAPCAIYALNGNTPWQSGGGGIYYDTGPVAVGTSPSTDYGLYVTGGNRGIYGVASAGTQSVRPFGVVADLETSAAANSGGGFLTEIQTSHAPNIAYILGAKIHVNDDFNSYARALTLSLENEGPEDYGLEIVVDEPGYAIYSLGSGHVFLNGKVGIGILEPSDMLEVNGIVHACAGGFRFPDDTVQSTAAGNNNTLDQAYDQGGPGAGRNITADAGAVRIAGTGGLMVDGKVAVGTTSPGEASLTVHGGHRGIYGVAKAGSASVRPYGVVADLVTNTFVISGGGVQAALSSSNAPLVSYIYGGQFSINDDADKSMRGVTITATNVEADDYGMEIIVNDPGYAIHAGGTGRCYFNGNVGIGTSSPSEKLHVSGNICATGSIGACSDARFKTDIQPIRDALDDILKLQGIRFEWKRGHFPDHAFQVGPQVGFIAQEVNAVVPEIVSQGSDGYYSIDYGRLVPTLVEAVKELNREVEVRGARLARQQQEIDNLSARLERLERCLLETTSTGRGGGQ